MTDVTAGWASSARSSRATMRSDIGSDVPGAVAAAILSEPSLNSGRKLRPKEATAAIAPIAPAAASAAMGTGARSAPATAGR
jgi:hypothetical protein